MARWPSCSAFNWQSKVSGYKSWCRLGFFPGLKDAPESIQLWWVPDTSWGKVMVDGHYATETGERCFTVPRLGMTLECLRSGFDMSCYKHYLNTFYPKYGEKCKYCKKNIFSNTLQVSNPPPSFLPHVATPLV